MATDPNTEVHLQRLDNIWARESRKFGQAVSPAPLVPSLSTLATSIMGSLLLLARDHDLGDGALRDIDAECLGVWHEDNDRTRGVRSDFTPRACWNSLITGQLGHPLRHRRAVQSLTRLLDISALERATSARKTRVIRTDIFTIPEEGRFLIPHGCGIPDHVYHGFRGFLDWLGETGAEVIEGFEDDFTSVRLAFQSNRGYMGHRGYQARDRFGGDVLSMTLFRRHIEFRIEPRLAVQLWNYMTRFDQSITTRIRRAA